MHGSKRNQIIFYIGLIPFAAFVHIIGKLAGWNSWTIVAIQMPFLALQIGVVIWYWRYVRRLRKEMERKLKELEDFIDRMDNSIKNSIKTLQDGNKN